MCVLSFAVRHVTAYQKLTHWSLQNLYLCPRGEGGQRKGGRGRGGGERASELRERAAEIEERARGVVGVWGA